MTDIFLSYAREDRERVQQLARAFQERGFSVWWDRQIPAGQLYDEAVEKALATSRAVVVLWSAASVKSAWTHEEAAYGMDQGTLIPVLIDHVEPPLKFRRIQSADLTEWRGELNAPEVVRLVQDLGQVLGEPSHRGDETSPKRRRWEFWK